ncbi:glycosyltransferase family 2 protein [Leptolyngbya sp. AN02str]|uniref:glycosyltransferase family 2 protein n=1 Tax=Leptolyngbya sp. AN02str TaxID=3423363 RepID=UPI003D31D0FD
MDEELDLAFERTGKRSEPSESDLLHTSWQVPDFVITEYAPKTARYCIGIPVINEGDRIQTQLKTMHQLGLHQLADIVIADGGSRDGSVSDANLKPCHVRTLLTKTGSGKLSAQLRMFFAYALTQGYEGVVIIDGNNKDGVDAIPAFLEALSQGWDYVQGSRYIPGGIEENTPLIRKLSVKLIHAPVISLGAGFRYTDTTNGFRALSRQFLIDERVQPFRHIFDTYNLHYYLSVMAPQLGYRVKEIPVSRRYPNAGPTPSKIKGLKTHWSMLMQLFRAALGGYRPTSHHR